MMSNSVERVNKVLVHEKPDRTPLFEIFQPYHPIHWRICGRTVATDMAMAWDAMADGISYSELLKAEIKAQYTIRKFFGLDMVSLNGGPQYDYVRPVKTGKTTWLLNGVKYTLNPRTYLVELANPAESAAYSHRMDEDEVKKQIEKWDGKPSEPDTEEDPLLKGVVELAEAEGTKWVYMGEIGAGTGVAFYSPFLLMWMIEEPELYKKWLDMQKVNGFAITKRLIKNGCTVIAMGGDVSCDKGPFISPSLYEKFILPVIQEHVQLIHQLGARAVYTSDGNHWLIKKAFFFDSGIDGYKEVDKSAGMTWPRLIEEGVAERVCIIGNLDARHTLCHGTIEEVKKEVFECLNYGKNSKGGHILHASHSVHEDVKPENYFATVNAYREFFGIEPLEPVY